LNYVDFIKDEKVKIQRFLSGLPSFYSDKIQYDNHTTLEETIRRARHLYKQRKGRPMFQKAWNDKTKEKDDQMKKGFKPSFFKNNSQANQKGHTTQNDQNNADSFGTSQGNNMFNVGDVKGITYIGTTFIKEKE
jgi:hypothetical protein